MLIFPSPKCGTQPCSANVWMHVVGSRSETKTISVPRGVIHFSFWARQGSCSLTIARLLNAFIAREGEGLEKLDQI